MLIASRVLLFMAALILTLQGIASADMFPQYTIDAMCDKADVIIEGTFLGKNNVRIDKIHKSSPLLNKDSKTIEVAQLKKHDKTLRRDLLGDGKTVETKRLVLFLIQSRRTNKWESLSTIDDDGRCGSCGLFWFDDSTCYGYMQMMNPGPYVLLADKDSEWRIPGTIDDLRTDIETGLANSREWRRSLAIKDPSKQAQALARYLLKSTAPKGDKGSYLHAAREPMTALGKDAVPVLIQVLRNAPAGEKLNPTVLILYDIGPPASQALPELRALLTQPDRVFTGYVLSALGSTGDTRAIPDLEKYLKTGNKRLAKDAREALAMLRKWQSRTSKENEKRNVEPEDALDKK